MDLCYRGVQGVQAAIDNGVDVNEECDWGSTGLMLALHQGQNKWVTRASVCLFNTKIISDLQKNEIREVVHVR